MSYLLDTNILIYSLKNTGNVNSCLEQHKDSSFFISVITYGELLYGAEKSNYRDKNLTVVSRIKKLFPVLQIDETIIECFARLKASLNSSGVCISDMDLLIASTAISYGCTLVTHNIKHFEKVPNLKLEDWF